jgi:HEPN domain-containing protein
MLEEAYISSRYLPFSFSGEEAKKAIEFVKKGDEVLWGKFMKLHQSLLEKEKKPPEMLGKQ